MDKPLIIFGSGDIAQIAHYYFTNDSHFEIVAFTVDKEFMESDSFCGCPVVPFNEITNYFPPQNYSIFIALSYSQINSIRKEKYLEAKALNYSFASYVSSNATVLNDHAIGDNCFIFEDNTIQPFVKIGDNVTMWSGNHIGHHSVIRDHCFIASHVVVSGGVEIGEQCFIGVNATLRDHISIGERCVIGAGTLIMSDTEPDGLYIGKTTERSKLPSTKLKKI